jgi:hypothetical protein
MSNSYFNFEEAPDFASALRRGFDRFNQSADRAEALERENDRRREQNAAMPLELAKALIDFAPTDKKMVEGINKRNFKSNLEKGYQDADSAATSEALKDVFNTEKKGQFLKKAALDNGDNESLSIFREDFTSARDRDNFIFDVKNGLTASFNTHLTKYYPDSFSDPSAYRAAYKEWKTEVLSNLKKQGFENQGYLKARLDDKFESIRNTHLQKQNQELTQRNVGIEQNRIIGEVVRGLNGDDPVKAFNDTVEFNAAFYDGNMARGYRSAINIAMMAVERNALPIDKLESVLFQEITAKGDKAKLLIDKLGGGAESEVWAQGVLEKLEGFRKKEFDKIQNEKVTYGKKFVQEVDKIEADTGRMTKVEYANYVKNNWDIGKGGGNLPDAVKNRLSKEEADDILHRAVLDEKIDKGIPVTKKEVQKLNNPFVEEQYMSRIKEGNPAAPSSDLVSQAKTQIGGYATKHAKQEGVAPGRESTQWINITQNAEREYPLLYAKYIKTADSPIDAHIQALEDIEKKTFAGVYDNLVVNTDANKTRSLNLIKAEEHIKTVDPNVINTGIIFGSEEVVKEAANLPTGQTHLFYTQLADKIPGVNGAQLQYKQVELYNKLNGAEAPVKSDLLLAYEKLDSKVQFYLSHHSSPAKVARAKIEAFKDDAQIDYDEISFLMPEAQKALEQIIKEDPTQFRRDITTEQFMDLTPEMQEDILGPTPQLGKLEPRKGDWQRTEQGTFIVWDGKQWKERGVFATGNKEPFVGEINEYLDRDKVRRKF